MDMATASSRRVVVLDDADLAVALRNDELTEEELAEYIDDGSPVSYLVVVDPDIDASFVCSAVGLDAGEENELADSDLIATSWNPSEVEEALELIKERLEDPNALAADLVERAMKEPEVEALDDVSEVVDILEQLDKGYEPDHDAHLAVGAAALLVRLVLALRVAKRNDAWVVVI